jgi:hypothetical protein
MAMRTAIAARAMASNVLRIKILLAASVAKQHTNLAENGAVFGNV